ncbi:hypothetical protein AX15_001492 [Amanita polypyramis BW_CC]|nr:hypothetical protein AX15_001492 [Amanita polypyramis BW_CC]
MLLRKIGKSIIPAIGYGTGGIGVPGYGPLQPFEDRLKVFDYLYESGCVHWDTADIYGQGEALVGEWIRRTGKRDDIFVATKIGLTPQGTRGDPTYIREAAERSLKNIGVQYLDLLYQQRVDPNTPIELTIKAMAELVVEGKVRYIGLSDPSVKTLRRAHAVHPIAAVQVEFSPLVLDANQPPHDLIQAAKELGIAIVIYSPLARGLITGRFTSPAQFEPTDYRLGIPRYSKENFPGILKAVSEIESISKPHDATPGQVTLAWTLGQGDNFFVIPGSRDVGRIKENLESYNVKLSGEDAQRLWDVARATSKIVVGDRDTPLGSAAAFLDTPPLINDSSSCLF